MIALDNTRLTEKREEEEKEHLLLCSRPICSFGLKQFVSLRNDHQPTIQIELKAFNTK